MTGSGSMSSSSTAVPTWRINGKTNPQELPQASQPPVEMEEDRSQHEAQKAPPLLNLLITRMLNLLRMGWHQVMEGKA